MVLTRQLEQLRGQAVTERGISITFLITDHVPMSLTYIFTEIPSIIQRHWTEDLAGHLLWEGRPATRGNSPYGAEQGKRPHERLSRSLLTCSCTNAPTDLGIACSCLDKGLCTSLPLRRSATRNPGRGVPEKTA